MARDYAYDDDRDSDSYRRSSSRSRRHRRRHRAHREDSGGSYERYKAEEPLADDVRRSRYSYYPRSDERRRRDEDEEYRPRTYDPEPMYTSRRSYEPETKHRSRESGERRRRRRRHAEDDDESVVYVYHEEEPPRPRRRDMTPPESPPPVRRRESTRSRRETDGRAPRRSARTKAAPRVVEEVVVEEDIDEPSPPRVRRETSTRNPQRVYMTRPSTVKRSQSTLARDPTTTRTVRKAPSAARLTSAHVSTAKTKRNNPNILSIFAPKAPIAPALERRVDCLVCLDQVPSTKAAKLGCGHAQCNACLKRQFEMSVKDPQHMPPRCCGDDHIPLKHVDRLFTDSFKRLWNKRYQEYTTNNRLYCPKRGCGEWIRPSCVKTDRETRRKYGKCPRCTTKVCVLCNNKWHTRRDCPNDEETNRIVEMAKEKGWQRCYNCKTMVELKEGCYHMTCRCTAQFCMLCAAPWKTCTCPWFEHPELDPADRIAMNIPQAYIIPEEPERPSPPPAPPAAAPVYSRRLHPVYDSNAGAPTSSPRRSQSTRTTLADPRSEDFLTRLLRTTTLEPTRAPTPQDQTAAHVQVYGLGNSGSHHMNESYAVRPPQAPAPQPSVSAARRAWLGRTMSLGGRGGSVRASGHKRAASAAVRRVTEPAAPPASSMMAGLGKDGKRGAERVNGWRSHIVFDHEACITPAGQVGEGEIDVDSDSDFDTPY